MTAGSASTVWLLRVSLVVATFLAYGNSLDNSFHYDDSHSIVENYHLRSLANIPDFFTDPGQFSREPAMSMYRPLLLVTFAINYAIGEYEPRGYHVLNILAHALAALLVFSITSTLASSSAKGWWTGMFFALHPVHSQAVNYISARSELLSALGVLIAFALIVAARREALAYLTYAAGLLVKSTATVLVPLLLMHRWLWPRGHGSPRRLLPVAALTVGYLAILTTNGFLIGAVGVAYRQEVRAYSVHFWTQTKALAYYAKLLAMPVRLSVEHSFSTSSNPTELPVVCSIAVILSLGVLAWKNRSASCWGLWALCWYAAALGVTFLVPLNVLVSEHRLYLASVGCLVAVSIAVGNGRNARRLVPYGGAVLVAFAVLTWQRGTDWQDELSLWLAASRHGGDEMFRVQGNLGLAHYDAGQLPQAVAALERAVELNPAYAKTWNNLGLAQEGAGRIEAASRAYARARELNPELAGVYNNLARLHTQAGANENAAEHLRRALIIDPRYAPAHVNLGLAYQRMGDLALAESHYRQALDLQPSYAEAYNNLGLLQIESGDATRAMATLKRAVDLRPDYAEALLNLEILQLQEQGVAPILAYERLLRAHPDAVVLWQAVAPLYLRSAAWQRAEAAYTTALQLGPERADLYAGLAAANRGQGKLAVAITAYQQATKLSPTTVDYHNNLASALAAAGRIEEAIGSTQAALEVDEDNERARENLARLRGHTPSRD